MPPSASASASASASTNASANVALSAPSSVIAAAIAMTSLGSPRSATPGDPTLSAGANVSSSARGASSGQRLSSSSSIGPSAGDASTAVPPLALNCPKNEPNEADSLLLPPQAEFHPPRVAVGGFGAMPTLSEAEAALAAAPYHHRAATMDHRAAAAAAVVNRPVAASLYAPSYHHPHNLPPPFGGHHPMAAVPAGLLRLPPPGHGAPHPPPLSRPLPPAGTTLEQQQHHQPVISATKNFPATLHDVISSNVHAHVVSWLHHGRGFFIHDKQLFDSIILQRYFEGAKFTSFTRRLKRWGFKRTPRGPEIGAYYNEWFKRDEPALLQWMTCSSGAGSQAQVEEAKKKRKEREEDSDGDDDKDSKNPTEKDDEEADIRVGNVVVPKKKKKADHSTEGSPRLTSRGGSEAVQNHGSSRSSSPDEAPPQLPPSPATVHKKKKKKKTTKGREVAVGAPIATEVLSIHRAVGSDPSSLPRDYPSTLAPREGFDEQRLVDAQHMLLAQSTMPPDVVASGQRQVLVPAYLVPAPISSTPSNHHPYYAPAAAASAAESQRALDVERAKRILEAERQRVLSAGGSHHRHQAVYRSQDVMAPPSNIMASADPHGTMMGGAVSAARFQPLLPSPYAQGTEIPHSYRSGFEPVGRNDIMASTLSEAPHEAMMGGVSAASRFQPPRMAPPYDVRGTGRPHDISSRGSGFEPMGRSVASTVSDASHDAMVGGVSAARFQGEARPIMMSREEERAFGEFLYKKKKAEMAQRW